MNQQIIDYLNQNKDKFSQEQLVDQLRQSGYQEEDIQDGVSSVYSRDTSVDTKENQGKIKIPWQGMILLLIPIYAIFGTLTVGGSGALLSLAEGFDIFAGIALFVIAPFIIISIFLIAGILKGWRWTIIAMIILTGINFLSGLVHFPDSLVSLIIAGAFLGLEIMCLNHPFYNKNK